MIPKRCIEELEVAVPDLETQRHVAEIDVLARREHDLATRLADKKLTFTSIALLSQVQKPSPTAMGLGDLVPEKPER